MTRRNPLKLSNASARHYKDLPKLEKPAGYVYIIQDVDFSNRYKIGRTNHPKRRINKFEVTLPFKTELVHILRADNAVAAEGYLHKRFAKERARGEWFDLNEAQLQEIRRLGQPSTEDPFATLQCGILIFLIILVIFVTLVIYFMPPKRAVKSVTSDSTPYLSRQQPTHIAASDNPRTLTPPTIYSSSTFNSSVSFKWKMVRDAIFYEYRWSVNDEPFTVLRQSYVLGKSVTGLLRGDVVRFEVRVRNGTARSPFARSTARVPLARQTGSTIQQAARSEASAVGETSDVKTPNEHPTATDRPSAAEAAGDMMTVRTSDGKSARVRSCPELSCVILAGLEDGTEIHSLGEVRGSEVRGSAIWIEFKLQGKSAYIHSSLVTSSR